MDHTSLFGYWRQCYSVQYATFTGRARRREYWGFTLFYLLFSFPLWALHLGCGLYALLGNSFVALYLAGLFYVIQMLFSIASMVPSIAVATRRLHDIGYSGWWQLLAYVPFLLLGALLLSLGQGSLEAMRPGAIAAWKIYGLGGVILLQVVCSIWLLVLLARAGQVGENKYGVNPKAPQVD